MTIINRVTSAIVTLKYYTNETVAKLGNNNQFLSLAFPTFCVENLHSIYNGYAYGIGAIFELLANPQ